MTSAPDLLTTADLLAGFPEPGTLPGQPYSRRLEEGSAVPLLPSTTVVDIAESWRPVVDHVGWYRANTLGEVHGVDREVRLVAHGTPCTRTVRSQLRRPHRRRPGQRWRIQLSRNGLRTDHDLANLILEAFEPPPGPGYHAEHIDGNLDNCSLNNLRWALHEPTAAAA